MKDLLLFIEEKEAYIEELHVEIDRLKKAINRQEITRFQTSDKQKLYEAGVKLNLLTDLIKELKKINVE